MVALCAIWLVAACSAEAPTPQDEATNGPTATESPATPGARDPRLWPYPADSIWNVARGDAASLVPFPLAPSALTVQAEEDLIIATPDAPLRPVLATDAAWDADRTRCGATTGETLLEGLPIAEDWTTDPGYTGTTPNHAAAVLLPDDTLVETQPLHVCADGTVVSQYAPDDWRGSSIRTGGVPGDVGEGAHGGSGMTAFGGTIRLGEWTPGSTIRHTLKLTVDGTLLSHADGGFRWPATRADSYAAEQYAGDEPAAAMGSLLTVAPDFDVAGLTTEPARILATALRDHGAYVVDDSGFSAVGIAVEWGPAGRVLDEFEQTWGFPLVGLAADDRAGAATGGPEGDQQDFLADMQSVWSALAVVDDNGPESVGGAGERMAEQAPPLAPAEGEGD
ncbi:MAG: hypothetical protein CMH83_11905 [Nocardioides sp.]|nr:hypothetical protein [Nocardioides sp.]